MAKPPLLIDPDIGCKFAHELVSQAQAGLDTIDADANPELWYVLCRKAYFRTRLQDQPLGDTLVKLALDPRGDITLVGDEGGRIDFE